jgi:hypothetical protein
MICHANYVYIDDEGVKKFSAHANTSGKNDEVKKEF